MAEKHVILLTEDKLRSIIRRRARMVHERSERMLRHARFTEDYPRCAICRIRLAPGDRVISGKAATYRHKECLERSYFDSTLPDEEEELT